MAWQVETTALLAAILLSRVGAQVGFPNDECSAVNRTGCTRNSSPPLEDNNNVVGFGIVTAIIILVVANLVICIARCLLTPQAPSASQGSPRRRASVRDIGLLRRTYPVKPVYVVNPGGSLRIGKQESKKPGASQHSGDAPLDLAERGMAPLAPEPCRTRSGPVLGSRDVTIEL